MATEINLKASYKIIIIVVVVATVVTSITYIHHYPCKHVLIYGLLAVFNAFALAVASKILFSGSIVIDTKIDTHTSLKAKGTYAIFAAVVYLLFQNISDKQCNQAFNLTLYFKYTDSTMISRVVDTVNVHYPNFDEDLPIKDGKINLINIPAQLKSDSALLQLKGEGYWFAKSFTKTRLIALDQKAISLFIERDSSLNFLKGIVVDQENNERIKGAKVICGELIDYTTAHGIFSLPIPKDLQRDQQTVEVFAKGYRSKLREISARGQEIIYLNRKR